MNIWLSEIWPNFGKLCISILYFGILKISFEVIPIRFMPLLFIIEFSWFGLEKTKK